MKFISKTVFAVVAMLLAACASWAPGEDEKGKELCANADPVLVALTAFHKDRGEYPLSLHELTPQYLKRIPFTPGLRFDRDSGVLDFVYTPSGPRPGDVRCAANANERTWSCVGTYAN